jgi:D-arabinose 1-dehydrogenase-like Zn-dependent alcohol dehydrogenase
MSKEPLYQVEAPEDPISAFSAFYLIAKGTKLCDNLIGNQELTRAMLYFAIERKWAASV